MTNDVQSSLPDTVTDLMERIQREWSALLDVLEGISHEQTCQRGSGGWSIKDTLAHISAWEKFLLLNQFRGHPTHETCKSRKPHLSAQALTS
ncbi:MAG: DinB family protein [Anaerolineae bacterium]